MPEFNVPIEPEDVDPRQQLSEEQQAEEMKAAEHLYEMMTEITKTLNEYYPEGIRPKQLSSLIVHLLMHMRRFLTLEELAFGMGHLVMVADKWVQSDAQWIDVETGETKAPPIPVEKITENPDGMQMMEELNAGVQDDDLQKLLDEAGE